MTVMRSTKDYINQQWGAYYLSSRTRPDIAYAVSNVAQFSVKPNKQHWTAVKRILRYLQGTKKFGLLYAKEGSKECVGYSDADWAGDLDNQRSTSGYVFKISGAVVSWRSKKQTCVALSMAEVEYMALANATQEANLDVAAHNRSRSEE